MILEEHRDNPDQINQEEVQAHRVHQADLQEVALQQIDLLLRVHQADLHQIDHHLRLDHLHRVHQVDQADHHLRIDHLHRVDQVDQADLVVQADLVIQVVIEQEVRDQVEAEVHGLEKMNNATIAVLN